MKKANIFLCLFYIAIFAITVWFAVSYVDVLRHQQSGGTDAAWNLFNIFLRI